MGDVSAGFYTIYLSIGLIFCGLVVVLGGLLGWLSSILSWGDVSAGFYTTYLSIGLIFCGLVVVLGGLLGWLSSILSWGDVSAGFYTTYLSIGLIFCGLVVVLGGLLGWLSSILSWGDVSAWNTTLNLSCNMTKPTKWPVCPVKTQISRGIRPVWSESSLCTQWVAKDPRFLHADSEDWSDWADAQADLSLRWAHRSFCWFCHEAAHLSIYGDSYYPCNTVDSISNLWGVWSVYFIFIIDRN